MYQSLSVMHMLLSYLGSTPGVWVTMLQSVKCGATVALVDNSMYSVRRDLY
jgi:hypothetical protein